MWAGRWLLSFGFCGLGDYPLTSRGGSICLLNILCYLNPLSGSFYTTFYLLTRLSKRTRYDELRVFSAGYHWAA